MGIVFGYFVACITAALIFAFLSGLITLQDFEIYHDFEVYLALILTVGTLTFQFANLAWIPAFIVILVFELKSIKDWLYYLVTAGLVTIAILFSPFAPSAERCACLYRKRYGGRIYLLAIGWRTRRQLANKIVVHLILCDQQIQKYQNNKKGPDENRALLF
jgi:hypothetical protein